MRQEVKTIGALVLFGTLISAGSVLAGDASWRGQAADWPDGRTTPYHAATGDPLAFSPAPFWNWNAGGYVNGLYYNPYYCYAPGSCVFGYNFN